ncbi:hypothetical protein ACOMHN_059209 [Nucella lapillus]
MMRACWQEHAEDRPSFLTLRQWLEEMMADTSGVHYLDMDLNPAKDYYTCPDSPASSAASSSSLADDTRVSPLFGKDSNLQDGSPGARQEGEDDAIDGSSPRHKLTISNERGSLVGTSDVIVHKELSPVNSGSGSTVPDTPPHSPSLSGVKSVRFSEHAVEGLGQTEARGPNVHNDGNTWSEKRRKGSESEDTLQDGRASPIPSPDAACDEVFTVDLREKGWLVQSLCSSSRTGQPRVFPQERHPCSLFRTSVTSDASSASDDPIFHLMMRKRTDPLDSQGESAYASSSSSGESFTLPLTHHHDFPLPSSTRSLRSVASLPAERDRKSPKVHKRDLLRPVLSVCQRGRNRQSNVYQQSLSQQRSRRVSCVQRKAGQASKAPPGAGPGCVVQSVEKDVIRPVVFTKGVGTNSGVEVTAL